MLIDVIGGGIIIACLCMIAVGIVVLLLGDASTRCSGAAWLLRGGVLLAIVLLAIVLLVASVLGG